jgi:gamma-glutamyl phosphate reductase
VPENRQRGDSARRKETWRTNAATVKVIQQALEECGLPAAPCRRLKARIARWSTKCCDG